MFDIKKYIENIPINKKLKYILPSELDYIPFEHYLYYEWGKYLSYKQDVIYNRYLYKFIIKINNKEVFEPFREMHGIGDMCTFMFSELYKNKNSNFCIYYKEGLEIRSVFDSYVLKILSNLLLYYNKSSTLYKTTVYFIVNRLNDIYYKRKSGGSHFINIVNRDATKHRSPYVYVSGNISSGFKKKGCRSISEVYRLLNRPRIRGMFIRYNGEYLSVKNAISYLFTELEYKHIEDMNGLNIFFNKYINYLSCMEKCLSCYGNLGIII